MLEAATSVGHYLFYHLLSGEDLPIKSQDEIHRIFNAREGIEFVRYASQPINCLTRVYGHRLWNRLDKKRNQRFLLRLDALWSIFEHCLWSRYDCYRYQKGDNWFSIGDKFARYVLEMKPWIEKTFKKSFCADEVFLQSILWNSPFSQNVYRKKGEKNWDAIQRLIDWNRGNPYCFTYSDLTLLRESPLLFARKFDSSKDRRIVEAVSSWCKAS